MLGLFGVLNMGARSMSVQRAGVEVAGQNLANVNNPAYARQRVAISTSVTIQGEAGLQGTGSEVVDIVSMRNAILDGQIQAEASIKGMLQAQQTALQYAQATLGTQIDRMATGAEGATASQGVGGGHSIADSLGELFNAFQSLSSNPTSIAERQTLMMKAESLAGQFRQLDTRLNELGEQLDRTIESEVGTLNQHLANIASLNDKITRIEAISGSTANDLRDMRQAEIEKAAKYIKLDLSNGNGGAINVSIGGVPMIVNNQVVDSIETYVFNGTIHIQSALNDVHLTDSNMLAESGSIVGTVKARDVGISDIRSSMNNIASILIAQVNTIHSAGFSLSGSTGASIFTGSDAATIGVNQTLVDDPTLIQASGVNGATGDNQVALALARLAQTEFISGQTLSQAYSQTVAEFGQTLSTVNSDLANQDTVDNMLLRQRDAIGGVSLDEEMTDLTRFQKAFQASARLITTVDEMLDTLVNLKR
jgi:flagellar hook-associated protein 1 FlgK